MASRPLFLITSGIGKGHFEFHGFGVLAHGLVDKLIKAFDERAGLLRVAFQHRHQIERLRLERSLQTGGQSHGAGGKLLIDGIPRNELSLFDLEVELFPVGGVLDAPDFMLFLFPLASGGIGGQLVRRPPRGERRRVPVKVAPLEGAVRLLSQASDLDVLKQLGLADLPSAIFIEIGKRLYPRLVLPCFH